MIKGHQQKGAIPNLIKLFSSKNFEFSWLFKIRDYLVANPIQLIT